MVLKGPWKLPLTDNNFLEKCDFNIRFAGKTRLCIVEKEEDYYSDLRKFSDEYLGGNKAIISHVLWYIRKKYCNRIPSCKDCVVAGYCKYYLITHFNLDKEIKINVFADKPSYGNRSEQKHGEQTSLQFF
jgi:hypothetical protein